MNNIYRPLLIASSMCLACFVSGMAQSTTPTDSLQRKMILERDYVPKGEQVHKEYFNPLDEAPHSTLSPINFVRETYTVGMKVSSRLFDPLSRDRAPELHPKKWYLRLAGGYPMRLQFSTGTHMRLSDESVLDLSLDHSTLKHSMMDKQRGIEQMIRHHDTDVSAKYTHADAHRTMSLMGRAFYYTHTLYGHPMGTPYDPIIKPDYPLVPMVGGLVEFDRSSVPFNPFSKWQYSVRARGGYASMATPDIKEAKGIGLLNTSDLSKLSGVRDLFVDASGSVTYAAIDTWDFGTDLSLVGHAYSVLDHPKDGTTPFVGGVAPFFRYKGETFSTKLGAKFFFGSFSGKHALITPDVDLRMRLSDSFSLLALVDGDVNLYDLRTTYRDNRYMDPTSLLEASDQCSLRATLGMDLGNLNGLSFNLRAGIGYYDQVMYWATHFYDATMGEQTLPLTTFRLHPLKGRMNAFASVGARYVSPMGLTLGGHLKINSWPTKPDEKGLYTGVIKAPLLDLLLTADYAVTSKLSLHADFKGLGGISFEDYVSTGEPKTVDLNPYTLNARVSYAFTPKFGLSISGINLNNNRQERWLNYQRPGIGVLAALSLQF